MIIRIINSIVELLFYYFRLFKVQKKIFAANVVLAPFMLTSWIFKNDKIMELENKLSNDEVQIYGFTRVLEGSNRNQLQYLENCCLMIQQCVFKVKVDVKKRQSKVWR